MQHGQIKEVMRDHFRLQDGEIQVKQGTKRELQWRHVFMGEDGSSLNVYGTLTGDGTGGGEGDRFPSRKHK